MLKNLSLSRVNYVLTLEVHKLNILARLVFYISTFIKAKGKAETTFNDVYTDFIKLIQFSGCTISKHLVPVHLFLDPMLAMKEESKEYFLKL